MPNFLFTAPMSLFYGGIVGPYGSLIAETGDVCEFEQPPSDGWWVETTEPVNDKSGRIWPPRPAAEEVEAPAEEPKPDKPAKPSTPPPPPAGTPEENTPSA